MDPLLVTVDSSSPDGWDDLVASDTDALPPHELHLSTAWLRARGSFGSEPLELLTCRSGERLVGGLVTRRVTAGEPQWRVTLDDTLTSGELPARLVGGLYDGRSTPLLAPGLDADERREVQLALLARAEQFAREHGERSVVLRTVDAASSPLLALLSERGYVATAAEPHVVLPVPASFEDYLAGLRASYRSSVRRDRRKLVEAGVQVGVAPLDRALVDVLAPLATNLTDRYDVPGDAASARTELRLEQRAFGGSQLVVLARLGERVLGFLTLFEHRGNAWAWQVGFDYDAQGRLPVYFELCYYALVELAVERGWSVVDQTVGSVATKTSRGCVARPTLRLVKQLA